MAVLERTKYWTLPGMLWSWKWPGSYETSCVESELIGSCHKLIGLMLQLKTDYYLALVVIMVDFIWSSDILGKDSRWKCFPAVHTEVVPICRRLGSYCFSSLVGFYPQGSLLDEKENQFSDFIGTFPSLKGLKLSFLLFWWDDTVASHSLLWFRGYFSFTNFKIWLNIKQ